MRVSTRLLAASLLLAAVGCAEAKPQRDTLFVLSDRDVEGLDPHTAGTVWQTQTVLVNMYEGLVGFDAEMRLVPALAVSWSNPDDVTWEFELRGGVRFHSGDELRAEDVAFSLERARSHPRSAAREVLVNVREVTAGPGHRVRIRTTEPDASLIPLLREAYVVSRRCVEGRGEPALETSSCGTGPYRLASRAPGVAVELTRFDGYWNGPAAVRSARFVARSYGDPDVGRFVPAGAATVFFTRPGTPLYERAAREAVPAHGERLAVSYLAFDLRGPTTPGVRLPGGTAANPFLDPSVRAAIALAVDRNRLGKATLSVDKMLPTQPVAPAVFGFHPALPDLEADAVAARRLLAATRYRAGFEVELDVRDTMQRFGTPLAEDLAAIGIAARVRTHPEQEFFARAASGGASLYVLRFSCRTGDAQEFLDRWVHSRDDARGYGVANFSYRVDPVPGLDEAIEQARRELKPKQRLELLRLAMKRVMEAHLLVPLLYERNAIFVSPGVEWRPRADTFRLVYEARFEE